MIYVGVDTGAKGAIAFIDMEEATITVVDMPSTPAEWGRFQATLQYLSHSLEEHPMLVAIESVHALPNQSCTSSFTFGYNVGKIHHAFDLVLDRPPQMFTPAQWQKHHGLWKIDCEKKEKKHQHIAKAKEIFPCCEKTLTASKDGRADALLIAAYLRDTHNGNKC